MRRPRDQNAAKRKVDRLWALYFKIVTPPSPPPSPPAPPAPPPPAPAEPPLCGWLRWDGQPMPNRLGLPPPKPKFPTVRWDGKELPAFGQAAREGWRRVEGEWVKTA